MKQHILFDIEIIGKKKPVFLVCTKNAETGETHAFWHHKRGDLKKLHALFTSPQYSFVSFNGINFDAPLICAAIQGADTVWLKEVSSQIIEEGMKSWQTYREFGIDFIDFDHIDLIEVAPGVMVSLKTYAGRLGMPSMIDMPFDHTADLSPKQHKILEEYCRNDLAVTECLFNTLKGEIKLREDLSTEYGVDLRSKSDAQAAEAILKTRLKLGANRNKTTPVNVGYTAPRFIQTKSPLLNDLIIKMENHSFKIDHKTGSPLLPEWLSENTLTIGKGQYQVGIGGLHSTHDKSFYHAATDTHSLSDFDVGSYYPSIILKCGLVPKLSGNQGATFLSAYREIYEQRLLAKKAGDKIVANSLKITLNGTYGKLGSIYSVLYSPDLMLAVTLTGQLNLLCLIYELERIKDVFVYSANTDGLLVGYPNTARDKVLKVFTKNSMATGFDYEETLYNKIAMKDVNNYIAIDTQGNAKRKGLYAKKSLMKNPTMEVCSNLCTDYLKNGHIDITGYTRIEDFVAIRNVKGGGVQHSSYQMLDDWEPVEERVWISASTGKKEKRKSRPAPFELGIGGTPFGRVARWYMATTALPAITYVSNGNKVPKTEGGRVCMMLPSTLPADLDFDWYIREAQSMLNDMGIPI